MLESISFAFLEGETPRLLDEWQRVPDIWDMARFEVDHRHKPGQFVLAGSYRLPLGATSHSGIGRISSLEMRTMSLAESGESDGRVSLRGLFSGERYEVSSGLGADGIARAIVRGGWPGAAAGSPSGDGGRYAGRYLAEEADALLSSVLGMTGGEGAARDILSAVSGRLGEPAALAPVAREAGVSCATLKRRLRALQSLRIVDNLDIWCFHTATRTRQDPTPMWHLADLSLAAAAEGAGRSDMADGGEIFTRMFRSLCLRDLRAYADSMDSSVWCVGDDLIVQDRGMGWGAFRICASEEEYDLSAERLLDLGKLVDTERMGAPAFLSILTAGRDGYARDDGVRVVPIGCLGP